MDQIIINRHDNGDQITYLNGKVHSVDNKPAITTNFEYKNAANKAYKMWFKHGILHREVGHPAVITPDGVWEFWTEGKLVNTVVPRINI